MSTTTGAVIDGRYQLGRRIGRGGMAVVHLAEDERLGRQVAVKLLDRQVDLDGRGEDRFDREARRAASLNHPNIVQVHDTGVDLDHPYIVMEFVDGPSLADLLADEAPLDHDRAIDIAVTVCGALEAAHEQGIVHRDIKPSNVLFGPKGRIKLADFGLAKVYGGDTVTQGSPMGSAAYVAPEQITEAPVDHRADLYSLGVMLYEMVTGVRPFTADTAAAIAVQRLATDPPPPSDHVELSSELEAVILRLLARDPDDRFQSAAEVTTALQGARPDATQTLPIVVADDGPGAAGRRRRWPWFTAAAALVAVAALLLWPSGSTAPVLVPDVSGMTVEAATRVLEADGLTVGEIVEDTESDAPEGLVLSQAPDDGLRVDPGSSVDLVVSAAPDAAPSPTSTSTSQATQDTRGTAEDGAEPSGADDVEPPESGGGAEERPTPPGQGGTPPGKGGDPPGRGG